jgi:hypothetical protein
MLFYFIFKKLCIMTVSAKFILLLCLLASVRVQAQYTVHTEDISNFWVAFDSVQTTKDSAEQVAMIQRLYADKASVGLKEFMELRGGNAKEWQAMIAESTNRLKEIRPHTLSVLEQKKILDAKLAYFKKLYPDFKQGDVYFTMGIGNSGGTTKGSHVLIGCEVAANDKPDWAVALVLHEFVHTQQKIDSFRFLKQVLIEGAADFVSELVNGKKLADIHPNGHTAFGFRNEKVVWERFKEVMFSSDLNSYGWLYGTPGVTIDDVRTIDLGYYMGHRICKSYFDNARDKAKALKDIIELDMVGWNNDAARQFVLASGYVPKEDIDFVKNTPFQHIDWKPKPVEKSIYGYTLTTDKVIFTYTVPKVMDITTVKTVNVAGSFNDWNPKNKGYVMTKSGDRTFTLELPKSAFDAAKKNMFKFVVNGDSWLEAPASAENVNESDNRNLVLGLK